MSQNNAGIGAVMIGRNEGARLVACAQSLIGNVPHLVYVDSGSTDDSVQQMQERGVDVVSLDMSKPFTAARARNAGFARLMEIAPNIEYVQFVDGDCSSHPDWIGQALTFMESHSEVAAACGRRREIHPQASIYNRLCDIEWDTPIGEATACGGDAIYRSETFIEVEGFNDSFIAGEEPELCFRIRALGKKVWRLDAEMTSHDADITQFSQWWKRAQRSGYAFALGASTHGRSEEKFWVRESLRALVLGGLIPIAALIITFVWSWAWLLLLAYPAQWTKIFLSSEPKELTNDRPAKASWAYFLIMGKFAEFTGLVKFGRDKLFNNTANIIEYK